MAMNATSTTAIPTTSRRAGRGRAMVAVLARPNVRRAQLALAGARAVDLAQLVVVSAWLFNRGGTAHVAAFGVVRTIFPAVGVPVITALGFRLGHGALLRILAVVAAVGSVAMAAVVAFGGSTLGVLACAAVVAVGLNCFRPVVSALMPALVRSPSELLAANAATGFLDGASSFVGPVLGSLTAALVGVPVLLVVTGGGMFAVAAISRRLPTVTVVGSAAIGTARLGEYAAGARELAANRAARFVTALGTVQTFVRGAMSVIVVLFAIEVLRTGDAGVGLLWGAIGVGGLVGVPLAMIVVERHGVHRSLVTGLAAWGLPLAACAIAPVPILALVMFGVIGVGNGVVDISYYAALQRAFAERVLTRVLGVVEAMFQAGVAAGAFAGALLLDHLGPRIALFAVGLVLPVLAILGAPRLRSFDRNLGRRDLEIARLQEQFDLGAVSMSDLDKIADRTNGYPSSAARRSSVHA
jgi:Na+/melibiose symporter-like transporter